MPIKEMRDGYTQIVKHTRDNVQKNLNGTWPDDYDWQYWHELLEQKLQDTTFPVGQILDLLIIYMLRTHSVDTAVNLLVALERNEIRLNGRQATKTTLFDELKYCGNERIGTAGLLPFLDICQKAKFSLRDIREFRQSKVH